MDSLGLLVLFQTIVLLAIAVFLGILVTRAVKLLDTLNSGVTELKDEVKPILTDVDKTIKNLEPKVSNLLETVNVKLDQVETELTPLLRDIDVTLRNIEPLSRRLGESSEEIASVIGNIEKVTDDAQQTTRAIRHGIVPFATMLSGILAGINEGKNALAERFRRE